MKKNFILLSILLVTMGNAHDISSPRSDQNSRITMQYAPKTEVSTQKYSHDDFEQQDELALHEYDQYITDTVTPSKVGQMEALFKSFMGSLLIKYLMLQEAAHQYKLKIKHMFTHLYRTCTQML